MNCKGVCTQKFCPWQHGPQFLSVPWRAFNTNSSTLRWEEASMHCNPTPYWGLKKTWERRDVSLAGKCTQKKQAWSEHAPTQKKCSRLPRKVHIAMCCGQYRTHATITEEKTQLHLSQGLIVQCSCHWHMVRKYSWKQSQRRMQHVKTLNYFYRGKVFNFPHLPKKKRF